MNQNTKFPNISDYIEAISNISGRTMYLSNIKPIFNDIGEVIFSCGRGYVDFKVYIEDRILVVRCFLSQEKLDLHYNYIKNNMIDGQILENELYVFTDDDNDKGDYYPLMILNHADEKTDSTTNSIDSVIPKPMDNNILLTEGLTIIMENNKYGFADIKGNTIIEAIYDSVSDFSEGRSIVRKDGFYGMIDRHGKLIIPAIYDEISWNDGTLAYVDTNGRHGCLDRMGKTIIPPFYDNIGEFHAGIAIVKHDSKYGYVDLSGQLIQPVIYDQATSLDSEKIAKVKIGDDIFWLQLIDGKLKRIDSLNTSTESSTLQTI